LKTCFLVILSEAKQSLCWYNQHHPLPVGVEWAGIQRGFTPAGIWGMGEDKGEGDKINERTTFHE